MLLAVARSVCIPEHFVTQSTKNSCCKAYYRRWWLEHAGFFGLNGKLPAPGRFFAWPGVPISPGRALPADKIDLRIAKTSVQPLLTSYSPLRPPRGIASFLTFPFPKQNRPRNLKIPSSRLHHWLR